MVIDLFFQALIIGFIAPVGFVFWLWIIIKAIKINVSKTVDDKIGKILGE